MGTQRIKVTADFNYKWPSKSRTALKKGQNVVVKDEVANAAIKAECAVAIAKTGQKSGDDKVDSTKSSKPA